MASDALERQRYAAAQEYAREVRRRLSIVGGDVSGPPSRGGYYVNIPLKRWINPRAKYNVHDFSEYWYSAAVLPVNQIVRAYCNDIPAFYAQLGQYLPYSCGCKTATCKAVRRLLRKVLQCNKEDVLTRAFVVGNTHGNRQRQRIIALSRLSPIALKYLIAGPPIEAAGSSKPPTDWSCRRGSYTVKDLEECTERIMRAHGVSRADDPIVCKYVRWSNVGDYWSSHDSSYRDAVRMLARRRVPASIVRRGIVWTKVLAKAIHRHPKLAHKLLKMLRHKRRLHPDTQYLIESVAYEFSDDAITKLADLPWETEAQFVAAANKARRIKGKQKCAVGRVLDRHAQRDPNWAISHNREAYEVGKEVAPVLGQVLEHLRGLHKQGFKLFFHGRDGELLAQLAHCSRLPVRYAVTSRPLTTEADYVPEDYLKYLERACPKGDRCAHVDTGYSGSIPKWMWRLGWSKEGGIHLVSSGFEKYQIPIRGMSPDEVNRLVYILEHNIPMRLEDPEHWHDGLCYSKDAPGWWAAFYGAADALGIPYCPSFLGKGKIRRGPKADRGVHGWDEVGWFCC
jgi:hypothetical protein